MMIGISTLVYDLNGFRIFPDEILDPQKSNENLKWSRRVSRTATLDGGVAVYDTGYAPGDRDITIRVPGGPREIVDWMAYMAKTYTEIVISTDESVFKGVPADAYVDAYGAAVMVINLTEDMGG